MWGRAGIEYAKALGWRCVWAGPYTPGASASPSMRANRNKHIVRHDASNNSVTHGWHVKLRRRGRAHRKFFSDARFGGKRKALRAAREHRDELVARLPTETTADRRDRMTDRNTSGVVGVRRVERQRHGRLYESWVAQWTDDDGLRRTLSFSVDVYGEDEARDLALFARDTLISDRDALIAEQARENKRRKRFLARQAAG